MATLITHSWTRSSSSSSCGGVIEDGMEIGEAAKGIYEGVAGPEEGLAAGGNRASGVAGEAKGEGDAAGV